jgi:hypothetical protein
MAQKKEKRPYIFTPDTFFDLDVWMRREKKLKNQKFENSYSDIVIFWFATLAYIFLLFLHLCRKNMYFFVK